MCIRDRRGRTSAKWSLIGSSSSTSRPVVYGVPSSISTRLSVGLCPGPRLSELIEVSTASAPASIAFISETSVTLVVAVAQQVLPAQQHLQPGVGQQLPELAQPLPGVLVEKPDTGVVRRAAPALHAPVAGRVDVLAHRDHVFHGHPGGAQALVPVAQDKLRHVDLALLAHAPPKPQPRWCSAGVEPAFGCPTLA